MFYACSMSYYVVIVDAQWEHFCELVGFVLAVCSAAPSRYFWGEYLLRVGFVSSMSDRI